jgi:hypothetical protein
MLIPTVYVPCPATAVNPDTVFYAASVAAIKQRAPSYDSYTFSTLFPEPNPVLEDSYSDVSERTLQQGLLRLIFYSIAVYLAMIAVSFSKVVFKKIY